MKPDSSTVPAQADVERFLRKQATDEGGTTRSRK